MAKKQSIIRTLIQALPAILTIYRLIKSFVDAKKTTTPQSSTKKRK
jgi:hypothetical protein